MNHLDQFTVLLRDRPKDAWGNRLVGNLEESPAGPRLHLTLFTPEGKQRIVGRISHHSARGIVLYKREKEEDKQRNICAWSILECLVPLVDTIRYETDKALYEIKREVVKRHAVRLRHSRGYDAKVHVPIRFWGIRARRERDTYWIDRLGYEWWEGLPEAWMDDAEEQIGRLRGQPGIFPKPSQIWQPFKQCPLHTTRVILPGIDPQQSGSSFAWLSGLEQSGGTFRFRNAPATWAAQGVLMPNLILTGGGHINHNDWQDLVLRLIDRRLNVSLRYGSVILSMGRTIHDAIADRVDTDLHKLIFHPQPHEQQFLHTNPFTHANSWLASKGFSPVTW